MAAKRKPAGKRKSSAKKSTKQPNGAVLGFERTLWQAADKLRNNMDAAEYKHVVLGLIFLKYISDAFQEHHDKLQAEPHADPEDRDEYTGANVFWVPKKARWEHLRANAKQPVIGKLIDDAMVAIEKENPRLKGVLPKDYARPTLDKRSLGELIDLTGTVGLGDAENRSKDILGRVYEYFLAQFASAEGKKGGQFYTPRCVVRVLVAMLAPHENARIFDPCCGSGGMFVQSEEFVEAHGGRRGAVAIYGQESIRKSIIEADLVDCMVALPGQLFYSTQIPVCLWFLARNKGNSMFRDRRGQTLFIDARKLGAMVDRTHRELTGEDIEKIAGTYHTWRGDPESASGEYEDIPGFCYSATTAELAEHGCILTPGRYVGAEAVEDDDEPFEEKMARLTTTLGEQFTKSAKLEKAIRKNLEGLGYGL